MTSPDSFSFQILPIRTVSLTPTTFAVLFGSVSSPFVLFATLNYHLQQYNNPTSRDIQCNLYVDNVVTGSDSESQALATLLPTVTIHVIRGKVQP